MPPCLCTARGRHNAKHTHTHTVHLRASTSVTQTLPYDDSYQCGGSVWAFTDGGNPYNRAPASSIPPLRHRPCDQCGRVKRGWASSSCSMPSPPPPPHPPVAVVVQRETETERRSFHFVAHGRLWSVSHARRRTGERVRRAQQREHGRARPDNGVAHMPGLQHYSSGGGYCSPETPSCTGETSAARLLQKTARTGCRRKGTPR